MVGLWFTESFCSFLFLFFFFLFFFLFSKGKKQTNKQTNKQTKKKNMGNHHSIEAREALMAAIEAQDLKKMKNHIKTLSSSSEEGGEEGGGRDKEEFLSFRVYGLTPFHCCVNNNFVEGSSSLFFSSFSTLSTPPSLSSSFPFIVV